MIRFLSLPAIFLFGFVICLSEDAFTPFEPDSVTKETFEIGAPDYDPDADAVILHRTKYLKWNKDWNYGREEVYKFRVKILKEDAVDDYPYFEVRYDNDIYENKKEKIKIACHNLTAKGEIETSYTKDYYFMEFRDYYNRSFIRIPVFNVKVGSIIDFEYTVYRYDRLWPDQWQYQFEYPMLYSEYIFDVVEHIDFDAIETGEIFPVTDTSKRILCYNRGLPYEIRRNKIVLNDVPAFKHWRNLDCPNEYRSFLTFQRLSAAYVDYSGRRSRPAKYSFQMPYYTQLDTIFGRKLYTEWLKEAEEAAPEIIKELRLDMLATPKDKIDSIFHYVDSKITSYTPNTTAPNPYYERFIYNESGNGAATNLFLITLLKEAGFDARPMFVRDRETLSPEEFNPLLGDYPYMFVYVTHEGKEYYMTPSFNHDTPDYLPVRFTDCKAIVPTDSLYVWKTPPANTNNTFILNLEVDFDPTAKRNKAKGNITGTGYYKDVMNSQTDLIEFDNGEVYDEFHQYLERNVGCDSIYSSERKGFESRDSLPACSFEMKYPVTYGGDSVVINPFRKISKKKTLGYEHQERPYPIQLRFVSNELYDFTLNLPDDYVFSQLPKSDMAKLADGSISFMYQVDKISEKTVQISAMLSYNKRTYEPDYYPALRDLHKAIREMMEREIVIKKKA